MTAKEATAVDAAIDHARRLLVIARELRAQSETLLARVRERPLLSEVGRA